MTRFIFLFFLYPLFVNAQTSVEQVDQLMIDLKYEEALASIKDIEQSIAPTEKFTAWELNFQGEVWKVVHGKNHLYYQLHLSNATKEAPGRKQAFPSISVNREQSDWKFAIVCVELSSGRILWSRNLNGLVNLSVDPNTDVLRLSRELDITLDPATGKILSEQVFARKDKEQEIDAVWIGGQAFHITGSKIEADAVVPVSPKLELAYWSFLFPWGKYTSNHHQLRGGGYINYWLPLAALEKHLLALDDHGILYFLDPMNGIVNASVHLAKDYLAMPFQYGNQLIVPSYHGIKSYSIPHLVEPDTSLYSDLKMRQVTCLFNLEQYKEALSLLDTLIEQAPHHGTAWQKRAQICMALGNREEEFFSYSRYLTLTAKTEDYQLYNKWGILRRYHVEGKPVWSLVSTTDHIFTGSLPGKVWTVQKSNLYFMQVSRLNQKIRNIREITMPEFWPGSNHQKTYAVRDWINPKVDRSWYKMGGEERISAPYAYRGKQYRTTLDGGIRMLEDTNFVILPPQMEGLGPWKIHFGSDKLLGYGKGVVELDEDLRPNKWLIKPQVNGVTPNHLEITYIQTVGQSIGLIVNSSEGAVMQVYTRNGQLLHEASLGRFISPRCGPKAFITTGNGFLFSDRQMTWLSAEQQGKIWQLGPSLERSQGPRFGDRWRYFGNPLLENGCVYVTAGDGHLYVIDAKRIGE